MDRRPWVRFSMESVVFSPLNFFPPLSFSPLFSPLLFFSLLFSPLFKFSLLFSLLLFPFLSSSCSLCHLNATTLSYSTAIGLTLNQIHAHTALRLYIYIYTYISAVHFCMVQNNCIYWSVSTTQLTKLTVCVDMSQL